MKINVMILKWKSSQILTILGAAPNPILGLSWLPFEGRRSILTYAEGTPVRSHDWCPAPASVQRRDSQQQFFHSKPMGDITAQVLHLLSAISPLKPAAEEIMGLDQSQSTLIMGGCRHLLFHRVVVVGLEWGCWQVWVQLGFD